jgi:DNA invertase Pin-like site-specific DNA recombinase
MNMMSKIADRHLSRQACIYIRQSTLAQVRINQESTERQYNLMNKAKALGWSQEQIRVLDRDLGHSGAAASNRVDFKSLVSDVAMGQVGAIFSLEASRLARSNQDWHRLLERVRPLANVLFWAHRFEKSYSKIVPNARLS